MVRNVEKGTEAVPVIATQQMVRRTIPTMELRVDEAIAGKPAVMDVVLSSVQIVDSAGLNWLLSVQSRLDSMNIRMRLVDLSPIMADALLATRLDSRFTVEATSAAGDGQGNGSGGDNGH